MATKIKATIKATRSSNKIILIFTLQEETVEVIKDIKDTFIQDVTNIVHDLKYRLSNVSKLLSPKEKIQTPKCSIASQNKIQLVITFFPDNSIADSPTPDFYSASLVGVFLTRYFTEVLYSTSSLTAFTLPEVDFQKKLQNDWRRCKTKITNYQKPNASNEDSKTETSKRKPKTTEEILQEKTDELQKFLDTTANNVTSSIDLKQNCPAGTDIASTNLLAEQPPALTPLDDSFQPGSPIKMADAQPAADFVTGRAASISIIGIGSPKKYSRKPKPSISTAFSVPKSFSISPGESTSPLADNSNAETAAINSPDANSMTHETKTEIGELQEVLACLLDIKNDFGIVAHFAKASGSVPIGKTVKAIWSLYKFHQLNQTAEFKTTPGYDTMLANYQNTLITIHSFSDWIAHIKEQVIAHITKLPTYQTQQENFHSFINTYLYSKSDAIESSATHHAQDTTKPTLSSDAKVLSADHVVTIMREAADLGYGKYTHGKFSENTFHSMMILFWYDHHKTIGNITPDNTFYATMEQNYIRAVASILQSSLVKKNLKQIIELIKKQEFDKTMTSKIMDFFKTTLSSTPTAPAKKPETSHYHPVLFYGNLSPKPETSALSVSPPSSFSPLSLTPSSATHTSSLLAAATARKDNFSPHSSLKAENVTSALASSPNSAAPTHFSKQKSITIASVDIKQGELTKLTFEPCKPPRMFNDGKTSLIYKFQAQEPLTPQLKTIFSSLKIAEKISNLYLKTEIVSGKEITRMYVVDEETAEKINRMIERINADPTYFETLHQPKPKTPMDDDPDLEAEDAAIEAMSSSLLSCILPISFKGKPILPTSTPQFNMTPEEEKEEVDLKNIKSCMQGKKTLHKIITSITKPISLSDFFKQLATNTKVTSEDVLDALLIPHTYEEMKQDGSITYSTDGFDAMEDYYKAIMELFKLDEKGSNAIVTAILSKPQIWPQAFIYKRNKEKLSGDYTADPRFQYINDKIFSGTLSQSSKTTMDAEEKITIEHVADEKAEAVPPAHPASEPEPIPATMQAAHTNPDEKTKKLREKANEIEQADGSKLKILAFLNNLLKKGQNAVWPLRLIEVFDMLCFYNEQVKKFNKNPTEKPDDFLEAQQYILTKAKEIATQPEFVTFIQTNMDELKDPAITANSSYDYIIIFIEEFIGLRPIESDAPEADEQEVDADAQKIDLAYLSESFRILTVSSKHSSANPQPHEQKNDINSDHSPPQAIKTPSRPSSPFFQKSSTHVVAPIPDPNARSAPAASPASDHEDDEVEIDLNLGDDDENRHSFSLRRDS